jgi:hypothetical protein
MCKKRQSIVLLLILLSFSAFSQRKLKGQKDTFIGVGLSKLGNYGKLGGSYNIGEKTSIALDLMVERGKIKNFDFQTYNLSGAFLLNVFNIKKVVYFSPALGLTANLSNVKKLKEGGRDKESFDYGLFGGLLIEGFITNRFLIFANADQRWFISNKFGSLAWYSGAGFKYTFN